MGCCHSSVDSSTPSILPSRVLVHSTPSILLSIYIWFVSCIKGENKQKRGPFKKTVKSIKWWCRCPQVTRIECANESTTMLFVFTVLMCGQQSCLSNSSQILWTSTSMTRFDDFLDFGQQLICPSLPHSSAIFVKLSKSFIFLVKPFLVNFYRQYAIFSCPTDLNPCYI